MSVCVSQCRGQNCLTCDNPCAPPPTGANPCLNGGTCNVSAIKISCAQDNTNCLYSQYNSIISDTHTHTHTHSNYKTLVRCMVKCAPINVTSCNLQAQGIDDFTCDCRQGFTGMTVHAYYVV